MRLQVWVGFGEANSNYCLTENMDIHSKSDILIAFQYQGSWLRDETAESRMRGVLQDFFLGFQDRWGAPRFFFCPEGNMRTVVNYDAAHAAEHLGSIYFLQYRFTFDIIWQWFACL
eukprot:g38755.t1